LTLRDDAGNWIDEPENLKSLVRQFYVDLFTEDTVEREHVVSWNTYPNSVERHHDRLSAQVQLSECKIALFEMGPHKSPGEDGYPAIFFQQCWDTVANSLFQFVNQVWVNPSLISFINNTLIVMIPKVDKPEFVTQFRPISLCNVVYKIISKVIVRRIKPLLNDVISPYQSSFIPGRSIHHNIIVANEMVHSMSRMKGKKMFMSIKIDLEKAYDRLNWNFIEQCLEDCKFPPKLIQVIHHCISSPSYKIMWNGEKTDSFNPTRGIRQGDPLSPYLFVICMERLSHIIADQVEAEYWKPMRAGRYGPQISHLPFANDLLLFAEASIEQAHCVMHCLDLFCQASGQKINNQKTQFSKNVDSQLRDDILLHTGFSHVTNLGRYLGANLANGRSTRGHFKHIVHKIQNKLSGWKQQCLSLAGRITLSKSVISSIPYYHMQYAKIPKTICDEIEKIQRGFLWGNTDQGRKTHLVNWNVCCQP
jgi:hypothetical protein